MHLKQLFEKLDNIHNISYELFSSRINTYNWDIETAINTPKLAKWEKCPARK